MWRNTRWSEYIKRRVCSDKQRRGQRARGDDMVETGEGGNLGIIKSDFGYIWKFETREGGVEGRQLWSAPKEEKKRAQRPTPRRGPGLLVFPKGKKDKKKVREKNGMVTVNQVGTERITPEELQRQLTGRAGLSGQLQTDGARDVASGGRKEGGDLRRVVKFYVTPGTTSMTMVSCIYQQA